MQLIIFIQIHDVESLMERQEEWNTLNREEQDSKRGILEAAKRDVQNWLLYAAETLELLGYLTRDAPKPFNTSVLGDRLASMLNHNLQQLCGKKCTELKVVLNVINNNYFLQVRDPSRFRWDPRKLTGQVVDVYLNLASTEFAGYIAADERSYTPEKMDEITKKLGVHSIIPPNLLERFKNLTDIAKQIYVQKAQEEEELELDDAPEEFKGLIHNSCFFIEQIL